MNKAVCSPAKPCIHEHAFHALCALLLCDTILMMSPITTDGHEYTYVAMVTSNLYPDLDPLDRHVLGLAT